MIGLVSWANVLIKLNISPCHPYFSFHFYLPKTKANSYISEVVTYFTDVSLHYFPPSPSVKFLPIYKLFLVWCSDANFFLRDSFWIHFWKFQNMLFVLLIGNYHNIHQIYHNIVYTLSPLNKISTLTQE